MRRSHTWAALAGEGEVIVARNIIPLAVLVPNHDHTVLSCGEEAVWLTLPPVLKLLMGGEDKNKLCFQLSAQIYLEVWQQLFEDAFLSSH